MYIIIIEITPTNVKKSAKQSLKMRESITVPVDETMVSAAMKSELQSSMPPPPAKEKRNLNDVLVAVMYAQWAVMALLVCIVFIRLVYSSDNLWLFLMIFTLILLFFFGPSFIAVDQLMRLRQGRPRDAEKVVEAPAATEASTAAAATTKEVVETKPSVDAQTVKVENNEVKNNINDKEEQPLPSEAASETTVSPTPVFSTPCINPSVCLFVFLSIYLESTGRHIIYCTD